MTSVRKTAAQSVPCPQAQCCGCPSPVVKHLDLEGDSEEMNYYRNTNRQIVAQNGYRPRIVSKEMAFYCFDVLASHLHRIQEPPWPKFTNDPL